MAFAIYTPSGVYSRLGVYGKSVVRSTDFCLNLETVLDLFVRLFFLTILWLFFACNFWCIAALCNKNYKEKRVVKSIKERCKQIQNSLLLPRGVGGWA